VGQRACRAFFRGHPQLAPKRPIGPSQFALRARKTEPRLRLNHPPANSLEPIAQSSEPVFRSMRLRPPVPPVPSQCREQSRFETDPSTLLTSSTRRRPTATGGYDLFWAARALPVPAHARPPNRLALAAAAPSAGGVRCGLAGCGAARRAPLIRARLVSAGWGGQARREPGGGRASGTSGGDRNRGGAGRLGPLLHDGVDSRPRTLSDEDAGSDGRWA
jgi:hypothetical protein